VNIRTGPFSKRMAAGKVKIGLVERIRKNNMNRND
jgi:hypothetical protein